MNEYDLYRLIMWQKVKGLRLDPAAYANLNKENMGMRDI